MAEIKRTRIVNDIVKLIMDRAPRDVHNDSIAEALGLSREQVRKSVNNRITSHGDIAEVAPWVYKYVGSDEARPTSAVPTSYGPAGPGVEDIRVIGQMADGSVLLQDGNRDLWKATRV